MLIQHRTILISAASDMASPRYRRIDLTQPGVEALADSSGERREKPSGTGRDAGSPCS